MPLPNIRADFDLDARPRIFHTSLEWASFWYGLADWFEVHGYTLHVPGSRSSLNLSDGITVPARDTPYTQQQHSPYAVTDVSAGPEFIYDTRDQRGKPAQTCGVSRSQTQSLVPVQVPPFIATSNTGRVYAAQDSLGRHVCLKLVKRDSEQLRVVEALRRQSVTPGVLPILEILEYDEQYAFLVMPRWGDIPGPSNLLRSVGEVIEFVVEILMGLETLHSLRIAHRDIKINNMVMNHLFPLPVRALRPLKQLNATRSSHESTRLFSDTRNSISHRLEFAIIDFDFAMIVPVSKNGKDRLPSTLAWMQEYSAQDVAQGELVYDPFKYDVGVLGVMFCEMLQRYTPAIPNLAPLLDRMTTHEMKKRFTAREAHSFAVRYLAQGLAEKELFRDLTLPPSLASPITNVSRYARETAPWTCYDRWSDLPPSFFKEFPQWREYMTPPLPRWKAWLREICETEKGRRKVRRVRKTLALVWIGEGLVRWPYEPPTEPSTEPSRHAGGGMLRDASRRQG